ncbi:undecaprenyl-diphosphate phosphatase [Zavarzinia sp. CC-PAN008]|uniref:undecaprenyl-diphosphate phosphatase n=1 Tax=Zavarzinia sp. CC-PAN008 TaxID=3243332 RepID=UPI003F74217D
MTLLAFILGLIEGLTEFLPVSSTGHLILYGELLGFQGPPGAVFEIVIQLGAILAVCFVYWRRLFRVVTRVHYEPAAQRFATNLIVGVIPALAIGALAHDFIKTVLFSPWVVAVSLVVGGFIILFIEQRRPAPAIGTVDEIRPRLAFAIGFCQVLAMIPGVSRSGATICGALMMRVDRPAAAEFSFFLAIPTMFAATTYDLYKNWSVLDFSDMHLIAVGFITAFVTAAIVVRWLVGFVSRHGFVPFAWYRIVFGTMALIGLTWHAYA